MTITRLTSLMAVRSFATSSRLTRYASIALLSGSCLLPVAGYGLDVLTSVNGNRARILFSLQDNAKVTPSADGRELTITFDQDVGETLALDAITRAFPAYIAGADYRSDRRSVILDMRDAYRVKPAREGQAKGVDIILPASMGSARMAKPGDNMLSTKEAPSSALTTKTPESPPKAETLKQPVKPQANAKPQADAKPEDEATDSEAKAEKKADDTPMVVTAKKGRVTTNLFFPFHTRTAAASFEWGNDLFVVFSTKQTLDTKKLASVLPNYITDVKQILHPSATILQLGAANTELYSKAKLTNKGYEWMVTASPRSMMPKDVTLPELVSNPPVKPYVALDALQTAATVQFSHPFTGETLNVIPSYKDERGVYPQRQSPDVTILQTGQGIAYIPHHPAVITRRLRQGIRIARDGGLTISENLQAVPQAILAAAESKSHTFFPYERWKVEDIPAFYAREQSLLQAASLADDADIPAIRLKLVQLYMAEGMFLEALGLLDVLKERFPKFYDDHQLSALSGASNFMIGRIAEAKSYFTDETIKDEEEVRLWTRLLDVMQGERRTIDYMGYHKRYIRNYPPEMRRRIAILAADNALSQHKYKTVLSIFDQLEDAMLMEPLRDHATYMLGRIYAESGKLDLAEETLTPLLDNVDDPFLRARSAFTLATTRYKEGLIDRPTLIAELEPLTYLWRGDTFELNLQNLLGELYINNGQYLSGLRAWRDVATYFPGTEIGQDVEERMSETFVTLFNEGGADNLRPLDALSLYYEFRDLTPLGREGDTMIQNLASRMADVDLLDRAAALLEHQVTFRLEKEERSQIGAKLALIHLQNRQPEVTLRVLERTGYGNNTDELVRQRNHLAAISYSKLGKPQRALNVIRNDYSRQAKFIRTDIHWQHQEWEDMARIVEDILATRQDIAAPLDEDETQALLRLAIAYGFRQETKQLQYLRDYFTPLITQDVAQDTFAFLTSGADPVNRDTILRIEKEMSEMKSFLDEYQLTDTTAAPDEVASAMAEQ